MSSSVKKGLFVAGNPNELGLGYYSLPDNSIDPYLETLPQPVGRVYKTPLISTTSSAPQSSMSSFHIIVQPPAYAHIPQPSTPPPAAVEAIKSLAVPLNSSHEPTLSQGPFKKRRIVPGESVHRLPRQNKERKHTTDAERQLLMDYYDIHNTCTTCPEFTELMNKLSWDYHRTKIWLYNRKTYKQVRPADKRLKTQKLDTSPTAINQGVYNNNANCNHNENSKHADTNSNEEDSGNDEFYIDDEDESPQQGEYQNFDETRNSGGGTPSDVQYDSDHDYHTATATSPSSKYESFQVYIESLEKMIEVLRRQLVTEKQARIAAANQCLIKDDNILMLEQALAKAGKGSSSSSNNNSDVNNSSSSSNNSDVNNSSSSGSSSSDTIESSVSPDSEVLLLRRQVEMYCNELREEKQKRSDQEMRAFDHLAQINVLTLRNLQLEKALKKQHPEHSINISINNNIGGEQHDNNNNNNNNNEKENNTHSTNNNNNNDHMDTAGESKS